MIPPIIKNLIQVLISFTSKKFTVIYINIIPRTKYIIEVNVGDENPVANKFIIDKHNIGTKNEISIFLFCSDLYKKAHNKIPTNIGKAKK